MRFESRRDQNIKKTCFATQKNVFSLLLFFWLALTAFLLKMLQPTQDSGLIMLINAAGDPCQWTYLRNLKKQTFPFFPFFCAKFRQNAENEKEYNVFLK